MKRPIIISIVNHKGGCLKTSLTVSLGAALARLGKRTLLLDLDAQQNLTQSLLGPVIAAEGESTLYDALVDETALDHLIRPTHLKDLDIIPCTEEFAGADLSITNAVCREGILRDCFAKTSVLAEYDLVLIDNPPSISVVVMNSLVASNYFMVPCSADYLPMVGLTLLGNSVARIERLAPELELLGVVITLYARSERICQQIERLLQRDLDEKLFDTRIRVNTKAKSAPSVRKTIFEYEQDEKGRGTQDYSQLAEEVLRRIDSRRRIEDPVAANG